MVQPVKKESTQPPPAAAASASPGKPVLWGLTARQVAPFALLVLLVNLPLVHYAFVRGQPKATVALPFSDDFQRALVGADYESIGGQALIDNGVLKVPWMKNNPLWLRVRLPQNVRIEFDARSDSTEGDIKAEVFGNGWDHASGYMLIFGGWSNSISVIARLDEHGASLDSLKAREAKGELRIGRDTAYRVERREPRVQPGRTYRWRVERTGTELRWYLDNELFMQLDDPYPLAGPGHDRLGFSSWDAPVSFDNLTLLPL